MRIIIAFLAVCLAGYGAGALAGIESVEWLTLVLLFAFTLSISLRRPPPPSPMPKALPEWVGRQWMMGRSEESLLAEYRADLDKIEGQDTLDDFMEKWGDWMPPREGRKKRAYVSPKLTELKPSLGGGAGGACVFVIPSGSAILRAGNWVRLRALHGAIVQEHKCALDKCPDWDGQIAQVIGVVVQFKTVRVKTAHYESLLVSVDCVCPLLPQDGEWWHYTDMNTPPILIDRVANGRIWTEIHDRSARDGTFVPANFGEGVRPCADVDGIARHIKKLMDE